MKSLFSPVVALTLLTSSSLLAENWANWRGPNFDGSSSETGLPSSFSPTENIKWSIDLPGPGASTPVIWENHVFLTTTNEAEETVEAWCVDRITGKQLWKIHLADGLFRDNRSNYASPSPVTDGNLVIFFTGTSELVATDFEGKEIWRRNIEKDHGDFSFLWTFSSSPLLWEGTLFLQVLQRDEPVHDKGKLGNESYLLGIDPATGRDKWKQIRKDEAVAESKEAFTTPLPVVFNGRKEVVIAGGDCLTGHDPATGEELWRWATWNPEKIGHWRLVPGPVFGKGLILLPAPKKSPVYAIKAGGKGALDDKSIAWTSDSKTVTSDVSVPLFYNDHFYVLDSDRKALACVEPETGKVLWYGELDCKQKIESSPVGADGKIYLVSHAAETFVIAADPKEFKVLHKADFSGPGERDVRSCMSVSQGNVFLRTVKKLYCIGK